MGGGKGVQSYKSCKRGETNSRDGCISSWKKGSKTIAELKKGQVSWSRLLFREGEALAHGKCPQEKTRGISLVFRAFLVVAAKRGGDGSSRLDSPEGGASPRRNKWPAKRTKKTPPAKRTNEERW